MRRSGLSIVMLLFALCGSLAAAAPVTAAAASASGAAVRVRFPATVHAGEATAIRLTFPRGVAAMDGHLLYDAAHLELIGVAPVGGGAGLRPVITANGAAFGAYGLRTMGGVVSVDLVVVSRTSRVRARVVVESVASGTGRRLLVHGVSRRAAATPDSIRGIAPGRTIGRRDVAIARAEWARVRDTGGACRDTATARRLDVDRDGCADIVDIQALVAAKGRPGRGAARAGHPAAGTRAIKISGETPGTIVVDSTGDTPDADPDDGQCADASGDCTFRAAIMASERAAGDVTIDFELPGAAPVTIDLGSRLPIITRLSASLTIDGYSQPGSRVNSATYGSNAVPGVLLRGTGVDDNEAGLYITSGGNTVRGLVFASMHRAIVIDGPDAANNRIMGNWLGFTADGSNAARGDIGIMVNTGATDTRIGSADRADRNVVGNFRKGIYQYGPTTLRTVIQGNLLCIAPGGGIATCATAIDHDFGPKNDLVGGSGPGEGNIIGPTTLEGIELSHGWDPDTETSTVHWRVSGNRIIGNWVGFRKDGRYDADYRSGQLPSTADNANGINVYDGVYDNVISRNYIASVYDGIQLMSPRALRNALTNNIIGVSPRGEQAPLTGWGIVLDWNLKGATLSGNVIRNARTGGVGVVDPDIRSVRISKLIVSGTSGPAIRLVRKPHKSWGANGLLAAPRISSARVSSGRTAVRGSGRSGATVEVYRSSRAAGKQGLPSRYLGRVKVSTDGTWRITVTGMGAGTRVTALQIRSTGDTSAMSSGVSVRK